MEPFQNKSARAARQRRRLHAIGVPCVRALERELAKKGPASLQALDLMVAGEGFEPSTFGL
jgi:hypothetical protein